jgi:hypothetical protein
MSATEVFAYPCSATADYRLQQPGTLVAGGELARQAVPAVDGGLC